MDIRYGYRLLQKSLLTNKMVDCHIGAYGFENEDAALKNAKKRLEEIHVGAISSWAIETYSYPLDETVDNKLASITPFPKKNDKDKENVNET